MTVIYLVRHAQALGNVNHTFQGRTDAPLTELGLRQLDDLSIRFKDIKLDAIYSSPLIRAYNTAEAINRYHNLPIKKLDGIVEINGGSFEGISWCELPERFPKEIDLWDNNHHNFSISDGESMKNVYDRMVKSMAAIASENSGRTVAVASHGCAIRNYMCYALKMPFEDLNTLEWYDNTSVTKLEYDDNLIPTVIFRNDTSHLSEENRVVKDF